MQTLNEPRATQSTEAPALIDASIDRVVKTEVNLANTVLSIVQEVGQALDGVPYVKALSGVVLQIIKIRDEIKSNEERCREIIDKVLRISNSIYERLAEIAKFEEKEKLTRLESHLGECKRTISAVYAALEKHRSRRRFAKFVNRGLDELNVLDRRVDELNIKLILDILIDIKLEQVASAPKEDQLSAPTANHVLPPKPYLIVERESQVNRMLEILLGMEPSRVAILGGGGFGKTTLARSILHDPKIIERYQSRYFISCEGAADVDALLLGLGTTLGITDAPAVMLASIRSFLATSTTLMCLDNFETPWEPSVTRTKVEDFLASIADVPNLSLIITMRGMQRPSKIAWSQPLLPPLSTLSAESAREIIRTIYPDHVFDDFTQQLLDGIDGIPLAITLISNLFRDGETSQTLWRRWSKKQTHVIQTGGDDRQSSLHTSIYLSVESPRMKKSPDARILLAVLSLLPSGFSSDPDALTSLEEYLGIGDIHSALQTLRTVSLIETNASARIKMLSPIRFFCLEYLSSEISLALETVVEYYTTMMLCARDDYGNAWMYAQVFPEIQNIHSVLQRVFKTNYSRDITQLIEAAAYLMDWSVYVGYLVPDTIQMALERSTNFPIPNGRCLLSLASLYRTEGHYERAEETSRDACALFKRGDDITWEARASEFLGDTLRFMPQRLDQAEVALQTSLKLHTQARNKRGQANVRLSLGKLYMEKDRDSEAEASFKSALEAYKQIPDLLGQVNATSDLTSLHISIGSLVEAEEFATESLTAARETNYALGEGNALGYLGSVYCQMDRVLDARPPLEQALTIYKQLNDPVSQLTAINDLAQAYIQADQLSAAEELLVASAEVELNVSQIPMIWTTLGRLYICADRVDKAEPLLDDALLRFQEFEDRLRQAEVLAYLGTIYLKSNRLDEVERALKSILDLDTLRSTTIHRFWVLGDLYTLQGKLEDAQASLDAAIATCQNQQRPYSYQKGNIIRSMGTLHIKRGQIDRAIRSFRRAREFHRKAQWVSEQATDLKRLGEAYEMLERSEDAEAAFKEAEELMESVREARTVKP